MSLAYPTSGAEPPDEAGDDLLDDDYNAFDDDDIFLSATVDLIRPYYKTRQLPESLWQTASSTNAGGTFSSAQPSSTVEPSRTTPISSQQPPTSSSRPSQGGSVQTSSTSPTSKAAASSTVRPTTTARPRTLTSSYLAFGTGTCPTIIGHNKAVATSTTITWPAPTRSAVAGCVQPPATFAGTNAGFQQLCAGQRYCDPKTTDRMTWSGNNGEVTRVEIETLLGDLQAVGAVLEVRSLCVCWSDESKLVHRRVMTTLCVD